MPITDDERLAAEANFRAEAKNQHKAVAARYDRRVSRVVFRVDNGLELSFPPRLAEGLEQAVPSDLAMIEISPSGDGLHWPLLDADLYVPALLDGVFGSQSWMARQLGASGGKARTSANGRKGGRPRKVKENAA